MLIKLTVNILLLPEKDSYRSWLKGWLNITRLG